MTATFKDALDAARRGDYVVALRLWLPMAQQGDPSAQNNVAQMYAQGHGVTQNYAQALYWWRKAASSGFADAENSIGFPITTAGLDAVDVLVLEVGGAGQSKSTDQSA
jgi:TPR repeat protein